MKAHPDFESASHLIENFQSGDLRALETLYNIHYHPLWNYSRNIIEDDLQAEDIVMEAFLKTWDKREEFEDLKGIANYLFIVARNACMDQIRLNKKKKMVHQEIAYLSDETTPKMEGELVRAELCQLAFLQAEEFPSQMKKVFTLIFREGLNLSEVSEKLGVSLNTVKTHRAAAIKRLRQSLIKHSYTFFNLFFF